MQFLFLAHLWTLCQEARPSGDKVAASQGMHLHSKTVRDKAGDKCYGEVYCSDWMQRTQVLADHDNGAPCDVQLHAGCHACKICLSLR